MEDCAPLNAKLAATKVAGIRWYGQPMSTITDTRSHEVKPQAGNCLLGLIITHQKTRNVSTYVRKEAIVA
eukprot:6463869-Amphidinium_carterae.3